MGHRLLPGAALAVCVPPGLDHGNLDLNPAIGTALLKNVTKYIWKLVKERFPRLEEVELKRGMAGSSEGCIYCGEAAAAQECIAA
ncbi:hypothetical protein IC232_30510 [Microvirga sp. BT688]|uniref:hypothetical protein n=1 Tax=Microvirga sp. TaxID=1873136 RepID=UPI0016897DB2|nr:hypothetical protein [Microvirga sp.]MBD2750967.1 hypothetical protein [Microvirga sp.]